MRKKISILLLSTIVIAGCGGNLQDDPIDIERRDSVSIFEFVDRIDVVSLETNDQSLLSHITQVVPHEDRYYIYDYRLQAIFCFGTVGNFLYKIHSVGRGPEEYSHLAHFNIDPYNRRLILLDPVSSEILCYDLDGRFIEKKRLPSECRVYNEVYVVNKDTLLFVSLAEFYFRYYSISENRLIKSIFPKEDELRSLTLMNRVHKYGDSLYFSPPLSENEIYNLSSDNLSVNYKWDLGKLNTTKSHIKNTYDQIEDWEINHKQYYTKDLSGKGRPLNYFINSNIESIRYKVVTLLIDGDVIFVLYDKSKRSSYVFNETIEGIRPRFQDLVGESVILWNYGPVFEYEYTYYDMSVLTEEQKKMVEEHNEETDNPFLFVYHLKQ